MKYISAAVLLLVLSGCTYHGDVEQGEYTYTILMVPYEWMLIEDYDDPDD